MMAILHEDWDRLEEIRNEMLELFHEAKDIMRGVDGQAYHRAKAYWMAQVEMALSNDHGYLGSAGCSMEDTINELEPNSCMCGVCDCEVDEDDLQACSQCSKLFCYDCQSEDVEGGKVLCCICDEKQS